MPVRTCVRRNAYHDQLVDGGAFTKGLSIRAARVCVC